MLKRIDDFPKYYNLSYDDQSFLKLQIEKFIGITMHQKDLLALGSILLSNKPKKIFEIGTYRGSTSNFMLSLLPESYVISIAYIGKEFNNSRLKKKKIGAHVTKDNKKRFTQLYGNSHELNVQEFIETFGLVDMVLIDGDHSLEGVRLDTQLAKMITREDGVISWHDANPKKKYAAIKKFLEHEMKLEMIATKKDFNGGIAVYKRMGKDDNLK